MHTKSAEVKYSNQRSYPAKDPGHHERTYMRCSQRLCMLTTLRLVPCSLFESVAPLNIDALLQVVACPAQFELRQAG